VCSLETARGDTLTQLDQQTIQEIRDRYRASEIPWFLGYSGGKDSSAVLKLVFQALRETPGRSRPVTIVYCDTGVEIPLVQQLVRSSLRGVAREAETAGVPLAVRIVEPRLDSRFFVKVIGKGYPPPTNKFRWCTERLRITPVQKLLRQGPGLSSIVLLGVRRGESLERDRTIAAHVDQSGSYLRQAGSAATLIYAPILDYSLDDVWSCLALIPEPRSIDARRLALLYRNASGECPMIRDPKGTPCGKGRFGCWTCTVVRRDRSMESMISQGHEELAGLLSFRNWLQAIRDNPRLRCRRRRNGAPGPGPFTLPARREILGRLLALQDRTPWSLISGDEVRLIREMWRLDRMSRQYRAIERTNGCLIKAATVFGRDLPRV
jgi:DNA sulfur modification protein DndC